MRLNLLLCFLFATLAIPALAQDEQFTPTLNIGDPAPPLLVRDWIKGAPVQRFEKGKVYVVEFWATWCVPCKAAIPRLTVLAHKYNGSVTFIGIDVYEKPNSTKKVKAFVDSMGNSMDYIVAAEDSNKMVTNWLETSGVKNEGIPRTFVVNKEGKIAWIGHPKDIDLVLEKVVNNKWDLAEALATRNLNKLLSKLDEDAYYNLINYRGDPRNPAYPAKPDSALLFINEQVKNEPRLKYTNHIAFETFALLLKTNTRKAYEYGRSAISAPYYMFPAYDAIIGVIELYPDSLSLPQEIYQLGAQARQKEIDEIAYPELVNMAKRYSQMAEWHWRANDKSKAINAQQKAIVILKNKKEFSTELLAEYEARLQSYSNL